MLEFVPSRVSNDNVITRIRYQGSDHHGQLDRLLPLIPTAQKLIERYCVHPFKYDVDDPEYVFLEYQLCGILEWPEPHISHRTIKIRMAATLLGQRSLRLQADPHLPF
jgi:hypothetical protein